MSQPTGALGTLQNSNFDIFYKTLVLPIFDSTFELERLFPDSILFGSLLLYVITQNPSFGVLSLFFIETSLAHRIVSFVFEKSYGKSPPTNKSDADIIKCRSGFKASRLEWERIPAFQGNGYPSISAFFWGSLVSYMAGANYSFSQVLSKMNQEWWPRTLFATVGIVLLTILFLVGRIGSCEPMSEVFIGLIVGLIFGILFYYININLFGLDAVNFNGLPLLVNKTDQGSTIYVCGPPEM